MMMKYRYKTHYYSYIGEDSDMSLYVYSSDSFGIEAAQQRLRRAIIPLLEKIYGKFDSTLPKDIVIDRDNNLLINGTSVGDWRLMCCFEIDEPFLTFQYGDNKKRYVAFGTDMLDVSTFHKVHCIFEDTPESSNNIIYYSNE